MNKALLILILLFFCAQPNYAQNKKIENFMIEFKRAYEQLDLPEFKIDYKENLKNIEPLESVLHQEEVFLELARKSKAINRYELSKKDRIAFELIRYEINLNVERIYQEKKWLKNKPEVIPEGGVYKLPMAKNWYRYLIHYWVDRKVEPEKLFTFGKLEVKKVKSKIDSIKHELGLNNLDFTKHINKSIFFYNSPQEVQNAFEAKKERVAKLLPEFFPFMEDIPDHSIKRYKTKSDIEVPAFYRKEEKVFYFNYFNRPFNKRQIAWIYLHEANPGHHYQTQLTDQLQRSPIQKMFQYSGYREGWAAYVEEIGTEIGAYETIYDELGKYEWDLIRSVRVVLDIGMNYYGWDNKRALTYWQKHIAGKDDIAQREIKRMQNWPAQVITYKYGADKILKWRELFERKPNFNLKEFHRLVLQHGDLPFSVLEPFILNEGLNVINNTPYLTEKNAQADSLQRLNLLLPKTESKPPLLLWIGGGAWAFVDRNREMNFARRIAQEGIAVASVGHRLSPGTFHDPKKTTGIKHPEHIKDIAHAFHWLYTHADEYGYDKNRIYVGGYSSGAHLAALLSMDNRYLKKLGLDKSNIKGVIPISGTYDILDYKQAFANSSRPHFVEQHVHAVFGDTKKEHLDASPTTYVKDISVPMLLISDANMIGYTNVFEKKILETEFNKIDFLYIRNMDHNQLYEDLANNVKSKYRNYIIDFIL